MHDAATSLNIGPGEMDLTVRLGQALASALPPQACVALIGPLGAGKTRLVQAVAATVGIEQGVVSSPTFVLINEYTGRVPIYHFDVYRLRDDDEFLALGPEEYFARPGWTFVEWADRVADCLPRERLEIEIELVDEGRRTFTIRAIGNRYAVSLADLRSVLHN